MSYNATIVGSPTFAAGKFNNAAGAMSSSNYLKLPANVWKVVGSGASWAIEAWLKTSASAVEVAISDDAASWFGVLANGHFAASMTGNGDFTGGAACDSGIAINNGAWHHCVIQIIGGTTLTMHTYVDGVAGATFTGQLTNVGTDGGAIGQFYNVGGGFGWTGQVDEVAFWSGVKYSGAFTPPASAYAGTEPMLWALYHLSNGTDSAVAVTVAVNDANLFFSPYGWYVNGSTSATCVNPGNYLKLGFTGTSVAMTVDVSAISGASIAAKKYPRIRYSVDGGAYSDYQLLSTDTALTLATGLAIGSHTLIVHLLSLDSYSERYGAGGGPNMWLVASSFTLDSGQATVAPALRPGRILFFGDSTAEGAWEGGAPTDTTNYSNYQDSTRTWCAGVAQAMHAEYGQIGFGGHGWDSVFNSDVATFPNAWSHYFQGQSRLVGGLLSPPPDAVYFCIGANGGLASASTAQNTLTALRAACPATTSILCIIPFGQSNAANLEAAMAAYLVAAPFDKTSLINLGTIEGLTSASGSASFAATDGLHPDGPTNGRLGAMIAGVVPSYAPVPPVHDPAHP